MVRVLHTSDWHLGIQLKQHSREKELKAFLRWLLEILEEKQVEYLLHAGDIFHYPHPSSHSQKLLYSFLLECSQLKTLKSAIFIAGNHDSPARLDAPSEFLKIQGLHFVSHYTREKAVQNVLPFYAENGEVELVVVAVPFLQEAKLGYQSIGMKKEEKKKLFRSAFQGIYDDLLQHAQQNYPQAPIVGMGHCTCGGGNVEEETLSEIHSVGTLGSLPLQTFSEGYDYVALGHIHKCYPVDQSSFVYYSGTPIPMRFNEASQRFVLMVEVEKGQREVQRLSIPCWRQLIALEGNREQLEEQLRVLRWEEELPPFLTLDMYVEELEYGALQHFLTFLEEHFSKEVSPWIVDFRQILAQKASREEDWAQDLNEMDPLVLFSELYSLEKQTSSIPQDFIDAFGSLLEVARVESQKEQEKAE